MIFMIFIIELFGCGYHFLAWVLFLGLVESRD